jgi:predicted transporter
MEPSASKSTGRGFVAWMKDGSDGAVRTFLVVATVIALALAGCYAFFGQSTPGSNTPGPLADYVTFSFPWLAALWGGAGIYIAPRHGARSADTDKANAWCFIIALACLMVAYLAYIAGHDLGGVAWLVILALIALTCTVALGIRARQKKSDYAVPATVFATVLLACAAIALYAETRTQRTPQAKATSTNTMSATGEM